MFVKLKAGMLSGPVDIVISNVLSSFCILLFVITRSGREGLVRDCLICDMM